MSELLPSLFAPMSLGSALLVIIALIAAYMVFTLAGFGTALFASAPLAAVMPVAKVVPLLALLDCTVSVMCGWRARHLVDVAELKGLLPGMLLGQLVGVVLLAQISASIMAIFLGTFVMIQGGRGLLSKSSVKLVTEQRGTAFRHGMLGGLLGGLFGSGGFVYAAYLERRLESREAFRATQATLIALSTAWRVGLCVVAGLIDWQLVITALMLLPALVVGIALGKRVDLHLTRQQLFMLLNGLLVLSGLSLILRWI